MLPDSNPKDENVMSLMPAYADIPNQYKGVVARSWGQKLASDWFFSGVKNMKLVPKEGINTTKALTHIYTIQSSWTPGHNHKSAAVAYLLELWFESGTWEKIKD